MGAALRRRRVAALDIRMIHIEKTAIGIYPMKKGYSLFFRHVTTAVYGAEALNMSGTMSISRSRA
jgi:hypothetical protein